MRKNAMGFSGRWYNSCSNSIPPEKRPCSLLVKGTFDSKHELRNRTMGSAEPSLLEVEKLQDVPIMILANKQDIATAMNAHDIGETLQLASIRTRPWRIQGCSAKK
eukprot:gene16385-5002_t